MTLILDEDLRNDKDTIVIKVYDRCDGDARFFKLTGLNINGLSGNKDALNLEIRASEWKEMTELELHKEEYIDDFSDDPDAPDFEETQEEINDEVDWNA